MQIHVNVSLQPETHFFLGNMLAAKFNWTGAIHHYHEALSQYHQHKAALHSLRIVKCYLKFQHSAQSMAPPPRIEKENDCKPPKNQHKSSMETKTCAVRLVDYLELLSHYFQYITEYRY